MSENPEVLQQLFASEIGHTIIITPKNGEQFRGILLAVGPSFVTVKKSASRKNIFFDQIADWEVLDEEPTPVALPAGDQNGTRQNGAGSASPLQQHEAVFQLPVQSQPLYAETSPQPLPPQWSPPTAQPEPSTQKANEHAILLDAQIQAQLALIDARLTGKITGASIDILPPDFALAKEELKTQASKSAWDSIRQKYMYALNNNELGSQFGRVKPLISSLKTLIQQVPTSAGLRRHLAYLYYITGDVDDAFLSYKETCLLSPTPADWHNAAVLARRKPETEVLAYYILPQIFKQHAITDHMVAWFVFIGLAKQFTDASPLRDIYETSSRTLSEDEEQLLVDASIYLFKHFDKEELTQKLAQGLLEHKPCHELLQEASRHFMAMEVNVYQRQQLLWREARQQLLGLGQSVARQSTAQSTGTATVWSATAVGGNKKQTHRGGIYSYKKSQNYGFIIGDDGKDYFFHRSAVNDEELLTQLQRFTEERIALKDALPVTFEPTVGERGYLAMNVSSFLDIHEMFKAANNYANEGEYTKAVNQIKKVLAQDMVYPQAQELLEKWREYARASSVPRGTTPYPRAKRKQLIERDLEGAIPIFYEAIRQNDTVESAVKDLASLLMQLGKSAEAITVLNQNRHLATDQQRINNLLIDAYQKNGQYELAIGLLKQTLKTATTTNKKAQLSWRVGGCYMAQKDYLNAEYWFREVIALGQDNKSAQRNLAFCLIQLKRNEEAEQILTANLPDPQSAELLQAIVTARVTGETVNIPDFSGDMTSEISVFTRFFLDRCSYEGVPLNRVQQKNFEQADVRILEELASRLGTRRPRERAEYYLSAAKIILEHDEWDEYNQLYRYLCRSFASRGDAAIIESKPPDTAREWYCEALCVYDG
ncbi:MAG TPA: tetratricopeptide repeat protein, partial [Ktedonobacteraceae bacterium]|nr:tetratricopeptide repeat protein [Ktedonobacteraceae bacterium]